MLVVTSTSPNVANLLGLDVLNFERLAGKRRGGELEDGQRGNQVSEGLSDTWDQGDQRRQADLGFLLLKLSRVGGDIRHERAQESSTKGVRMHLDKGGQSTLRVLN